MISVWFQCYWIEMTYRIRLINGFVVTRVIRRMSHLICLPFQISLDQISVCFVGVRVTQSVALYVVCRILLFVFCFLCYVVSLYFIVLSLNCIWYLSGDNQKITIQSYILIGLNSMTDKKWRVVVYLFITSKAYNVVALFC